MITLTTPGELIQATGTGVQYVLFGGYNENKILSKGTITGTTILYTAGDVPNDIINYILFINNTGGTIIVKLYNNLGDVVTQIAPPMKLYAGYSVNYSGESTIIYDPEGIIVTDSSTSSIVVEDIIPTPLTDNHITKGIDDKIVDSQIIDDGTKITVPCDLLITNNNGLIIQSPDTTYWKLTIDNDGTTMWTSI